MSNSDRTWRWIKRIAKLVTSSAKIVNPAIGAPADVAITFLTDLKDDAGKTNPQEKDDLKSALAAIHADAAVIAGHLRNEYPELLPERLLETAREIAGSIYCKNVADEYLYCDFKGLEHPQGVLPLSLDDVFVDLKAKLERNPLGDGILDQVAAMDIATIGEVGDMTSIWTEVEFHRHQLLHAGPIDQRQLEDELVESDHRRFLNIDDNSNRVTIGQLLQRPGPVVLLGGPGSGKTTLVKRLARCCALGREALQECYPELRGDLFPIVISITLFDDTRGPRDGSQYTIAKYVEEKLEERWGPALVETFRERWAAGQCLLLLDGLDEVVETGRRIGAARAVDGLLRELGHNRALITSRIIGYSICRLSSPAEHAVLAAFSPEDVETFVRQWYRAYYGKLRSLVSSADQAEQDARSLVNDIRKNPRIADLASNPLMLTIIALIKHQEVVLPDRRVEFYEKAINVLIQSWNKARSLSGKTVGETLRLEATKKVWSTMAFWMHESTSRGALRRQQLLNKLVEVIQSELAISELEASDAAESYLIAATDTSGLLEARGQDRFAFVHQTFQEYLAAIRLAMLCRKSMDPIRQRIDNPRWHEVIRLTAGYLGVVAISDNEQLGELMDALLDEQRDPLEKYFRNGLRLAASCISDDVGFSPQDIDRVIVGLFRGLRKGDYSSYAAMLTAIRQIKIAPGAGAVEMLTAFVDGEAEYYYRHGQSIEHPDRGTVETVLVDEYSEAMRLLALAVVPQMKDWLELKLQNSFDTQVSSYAAIGLWRSRRYLTRESVLAIAYTRDSLRDRLAYEMPVELKDAIRLLLKDDDPHVRIAAARLLGEDGERASVENVVIELLDSEDPDVRCSAAQRLSVWGHYDVLLPVLLNFLSDPDEDFHGPASAILRSWGKRQVLPQEIESLLANPSAQLRLIAAEVASSWGLESKAIPVLIDILRDERGSDVDQRRAVWTLSKSSPPLPIPAEMTVLLESKSQSTRLAALEVLTAWGQMDLVIPALSKELESDAACGIALRTPLRQIAAKRLIEKLVNEKCELDLASQWPLRMAGPIEIARHVIPVLIREKKQSKLVVEWLESTGDEGFKVRTPEVNQALARMLKPHPRDSIRKGALRDLVRAWVWKACATT